MDAVFLAADTAGLSTDVTALVVAFVTVGLIFLGRKYLRKAGVPV